MIRAHALSLAQMPTADPLRSPVAFGVASIDARIGGGLAAAGLHEFYAATPEDGSAAAAFALMVAMRGVAGDAPVLWVREDKGERAGGRLCAAGLAELGFDPDRLVQINAPDTLAVLRAAADSVKCGQVGAVVIEPWGKAPLLDLTASRRLSMAANVIGGADADAARRRRARAECGTDALGSGECAIHPARRQCAGLSGF